MATAFVIGDSQTKYLQDKLEPGFGLFSLSGMRVEGVPEEQLKRTRGYRNIVIHLGTNNVPWTTPEETRRKYCTLIQHIRDKNHSCAIFVSGMY